MTQSERTQSVAPGQPDQSYGTGGVVLPDSSTSGFVRALVVDKQGRQVFVLWVKDQYWLYRYRKDGTPDTGFGIGGVVKGSFVEGVPSRPCDVLQRDSGEILLIGEAMHDRLKGETVITGFLSDGTRDKEFGTHIIPVTPAEAYQSHQPSGCLQANGNILITAGYSKWDGVNPAQEYGLLINLLPNGQFNTEFGAGTGIIEVLIDGKDTTLSRVVALSDGGCVVGGTLSEPQPPLIKQSAALARYTANGSLEKKFGIDGYVVSKVRDSKVNDLAESDGRLVSVGSGLDIQALVAVHTLDGNPEPSFNNGESVIVDKSFTSWFTVEVQENGAIVVAGSVLSPKGDVIYARILKDGRFDPDFADQGLGQLGRGSIFHAGLQPQLNRILLAGNQVDPVDTPALFGIQM
ncbi:hypothetical protein [Pseudomonas trivialis]|uniref:Delta-60 repeat domain-containing protein n=1 Tax=Pseudomonas trivialis TaxID=200450 RepID=A0A0H5AGH2_9PSED|nr:hypothetical protein [Pseudomonas trivialis]AKS09258.1 hypothetical protein AA957_25120 [Pseudomonas trivialis]